MITSHVIEGARGITQRAEHALQSVADLESWLWRNVVAQDVLPRALPSEANSLLRTIKADLDFLHGTFWRLPEIASTARHHYMQGLRLEREEYLFLLSEGLLYPPADVDKAYERFMMFYYEDKDRHGYIDVTPLPPSGTFCFRLQVGNEITPEQVHTDFLTPVQQEFFIKQLPDVYARFQRGHGAE